MILIEILRSVLGSLFLLILFCITLCIVNLSFHDLLEVRIEEEPRQRWSKE